MTTAAVSAPTSDIIRRSRWIAWAVGTVDAALAACYLPLAWSNLGKPAKPGEEWFYGFFAVLSILTPVLLGAAALYLFLRWPALRLQVSVFVLLLLRSMALGVYSWVTPNESMSATFTLLTSVIHMLAAGVAFVACCLVYVMEKRAA